MSFVEIKIENINICVEHPETWLKFVKPGMLHCISPGDYLTKYELFTPSFKTELNFNLLAERSHSANFIEEWIEKEYRDWKDYFNGKVIRRSDVSQPLTIAIVDIFNSLARDLKLIEMCSYKDQIMIFTINLKTYTIKMQYEIV